MGNKVPTLRFPEFTFAWKQKKISDVFFVNAGGDIEKEHVSQLKTNEFKYPIYANAAANKGFYAYSDIYKIEPPVVTVAGRGVNIGIAHARDHKFYPIVRLLVLKPKEEQDIFFFEYRINTLNVFVESTGVPQLTAPQISNYKVTFPDLPEQIKIAKFLTAVDQRINLLKKKKEELEQYKNVVMQKIFNQEIRFKDDNGNDFAEWEEKQLHEICKVYQPQTIAQNSLTASGYLVYGANGLIGYYHEYNHEKEQIAITCRGNTCGTVNWTKAQSWITGNAMVINFDNNHNANKRFFYYLLKSSNLRYLITGSGQPQITGDLKYHKVIYPAKNEQDKVAEFLYSLDLTTEMLYNQIIESEKFKQGLLQKMFA